MRILFLADRLSLRGGADHHLRQVIAAAAAAGHRVTLACGRAEPGVGPPAGVSLVRLRGLAARAASAARLTGLDALLAGHDVVHAQNVMNPVALAAATAAGRAVVTVQDHRVLCPGPGKTLPDGSRCRVAMDEAACAACLPGVAYREEMLALTRARLEALRGARLVVLSDYMARELAAADLPGARVLPPWVTPGPPRARPGDGLLLAGRMVAHKGVIVAWRAWRRAATPLPLRVAGSGPLAAAMDGAARLGWLDRAALRRELRRARALLFPSRWQEPFGILGVEALAEGTPVIVADTGGTRSWSAAGCLRVPAGDAGAMAEAVSRLAADPSLALRLGREGQAAVAVVFSRRLIEPRLLALYEAAARAEPSPAGGGVEAERRRRQQHHGIQHESSGAIRRCGSAETSRAVNRHGKLRGTPAHPAG